MKVMEDVQKEARTGLAEMQPSAAQLIKNELVKAGVKLVVTVPDSRIKELYSLIVAEPQWKTVLVTKEDEGIGICCGAYFGGARSALVMANAGFLTVGYPLVTLSMFHRIPLFMLISNRGTIGDTAHFQEYQGIVTKPVLDAMGVANWTVDTPDKIHNVGRAIAHARLYKRPVAVLLEDEVVDKSEHGYLKSGN